MSEPSGQELLTSSSDKVPFFKKRTPKNNIRKRQRSPPTTLERQTGSDDDDDESIVSEVITKERKTIKTPFVQSTRRKRHLRRTDDDDPENEEDDLGFGGDQYQADRSATVRKDDATRYTTEFELDAAAMDAMTSAINAGKAKKQAGVEKKPVKNSKLQVGPQKAPANLRVTARFDYQPDICKDYKGKNKKKVKKCKVSWTHCLLFLFFLCKETGFCGYGDSCIFLHDRGDYKSGWELDKEWEQAQKNKTTVKDQYAISDEDSDEEVPFACLICRNEFTDPVVTKCQHYFCEACAINNYKTSSKCFACGASTSGVFNTAKNILEKLRQKKERIKQNQADEEEDRDLGLDEIEGLETKQDSDDDDDDSDSDSD